MADGLRTNLRRPLWQGLQPVAALWFDAATLPAAERTARLLAAWLPGSHAWRFAQGDLLRFEPAIEMVCEGASGLPLCMTRSLLCSAPLTPAEGDEYAGVEIGLVRGAQLCELRFAQGAPLDLSEAIELADHALHDTYELRFAEAAPARPQLDGKDVREVLGDAAPRPTPEREAFLRRLRGEKPAVREPAAREPAERGRARRFPPIWNPFAWLLRGMLESVSYVADNTQVAPRRRPAAPSRWRDALSRLTMLTRVSRLLGYRHAAYLRRMMRLFDQGDLDEALRNAVPLNGLGESLGQAFSTPQRRADLGLSRTPGASFSIGVGAELESHLRQLYRAAFAKFDRAGRIDEAVFALAELLGDRKEAIDYLVRHGRVAQAAELALGWDMPAPLIIRLLMQAGDRRRAVQVARRDGAFSDAVQQLESVDMALANDLRRDWGEALAQAGDYLGAVNAVWPLVDAREQAMRWLLAAEGGDAPLSARALVQRAMLLPDTLERHANRIEELADPETPDIARTALAEMLIATRTPNHAVRRLAGRVLPAVASDRALGVNRFTGKELDALEGMAKDSFLRADLPEWKLPAPADGLELFKRSDALHLQAPAAGLHAIHDAAMLRDGGYLLALGEAGVAVVDARGRTRQRYAVPASRLVPAHGGGVALALSPLDRAWRIARLDLVSHAILDLGVMRLASFAPSFDGIAWSVVSDDRLLVLDTTRAAREALWHVGDLPGPVVASGYFRDREIHLVHAPTGLQDWCYEVPARRLQARVTWAPDPELPVMPHRIGTVLQPGVESDGTGLYLSYRIGSASSRCRLAPEAPAGEFEWQATALNDGLLVSMHDTAGARHHVVSFSRNAVAATIEWPRDGGVRMRDQPGHLLFFDTRGRLLDLATADCSVRTVSML